MYLKQTSKTILNIIHLMPRMQIRDAVEQWYFTYSKMARTLSFLVIYDVVYDFDVLFVSLYRNVLFINIAIRTILIIHTFVFRNIMFSVNPWCCFSQILFLRKIFTRRHLFLRYFRWYEKIINNLLCKMSSVVDTKKKSYLKLKVYIWSKSYANAKVSKHTEKLKLIWSVLLNNVLETENLYKLCLLT